MYLFNKIVEVSLTLGYRYTRRYSNQAPHQSLKKWGNDVIFCSLQAELSFLI